MNEQPTITERPIIDKTKKNFKGLKIFAVIILSILMLGGAGYSAYAWQQNQNLSSSSNTQKNTIKDLEQQLSSLKNSGVTNNTQLVGNTVSLRELGISITVPDSVKDLTYSYSSYASGSSKRESVSFSTKALTDKYAAESECTSFGTAPPLGGLSKVAGKYPVDANVQNAPGTLVKQFASYYIAYSNPQSICSSTETDISVELSDFKKSFSTIKEL
jgi:Tfp pilus assembly protein PilV